MSHTDISNLLDTWCCGSNDTGPENSCCNTTQFNISEQRGPGGVGFGNLFIPSAEKASAPTVTVTPTQIMPSGGDQTSSTTQVQAPSALALPHSHASNASERKITAIGAGVGVPLGIITLTTIGYVLWRRYKRLHRSQNVVPDRTDRTPTLCTTTSDNGRSSEHYEMGSTIVPQELDLARYFPDELHSRAVQEATSTFQENEMGSEQHTRRSGGHPQELDYAQHWPSELRSSPAQ